MGAAGLHPCHHSRNGRVAIFRQAVDAAPDDEPGPEFFGQAVEFVDVAFPITDMHAAFRRPRQLGGAAQIVEPAHALLPFDRHPGRIDLALQRSGPLELVPRPELCRRQAERQPVRRDRQAGMHQEPADRMFLVATFLQLASGGYLREPHLVRSRALEGEFRGVLKDQDGSVRGSDAQGRGGEMALEDLVFADIPVGKETVGGLGVRPVLKGRRQRLSGPLAESLEHRPEAPVQPVVPHVTLGGFLFHPTLPHARTSIIRCHMTNHDRVGAGKAKSGR